MASKLDIFKKTCIIYEHEQKPDRAFIDCRFRIESAGDEQSFDWLYRKVGHPGKMYLDYLKEFSSPQISWLEVLPIESEKFPNIKDTIQDLKEYWDHYTEEYTPFAEDGGRYIFCFNPQGEVWTFEIKPFDQPPEYIAPSFEAFMDECIFGERYEEFMDVDGDEFYAFMKEQGWVS